LKKVVKDLPVKARLTGWAGIAIRRGVQAARIFTRIAMKTYRWY